MSRPIGEPLIPKIRAPQALPGPQADPRPSGPDWDRVRAEERDPLGGSARRDGLRLLLDLLAAAQRVAAPGRLTAAARGAAGKTQRRRRDRLAADRDPLLPPALFGGERTGPSPVDRPKPGSKHHLITCGPGNPLAAETTAANVNDTTRFVSLVDAIPPVRGRIGRPRKRSGRSTAIVPTTRGSPVASCASGG